MWFALKAFVVVLVVAAFLLFISAFFLDRVDQPVESAFAQVDALKEALASGSPAACYRANTALGKAVEALYPNLQENDTAKAQWEEFKSRQYTIDLSAYNTVAEQYNDMAAAFPANLIGAVWGATEVERFA